MSRETPTLKTLEDTGIYSQNEAAVILNRTDRTIRELVKRGLLATTADKRILGVSLRRFLGRDAELLQPTETLEERRRRDRAARKASKALV